jgi:hypothetical protein
MVENSIIWPKFKAFSMHSFTQPLQYFHIISLVDCLALWNEMKVNITLDIKEGEAMKKSVFFNGINGSKRAYMLKSQIMIILISLQYQGYSSS